MEEWLILQLPQILILTGGAVFLNLFDRKYGQSKGFFTLFSAILMIAAMAWLTIAGANLREVITLLTIFLLLNIGEKL